MPVREGLQLHVQVDRERQRGETETDLEVGEFGDGETEEDDVEQLAGVDVGAHVEQGAALMMLTQFDGLWRGRDAPGGRGGESAVELGGGGWRESEKVGERESENNCESAHGG